MCVLVMVLMIISVYRNTYFSNYSYTPEPWTLGTSASGDNDLIVRESIANNFQLSCLYSYATSFYRKYVKKLLV